MITTLHPAISSLMSQLWAMDCDRLGCWIRSLCNADLSGVVALAGPTTEAAAPGYHLAADGTAEIPISGVILKKVPAFMSLLGVEATSAQDTQQALILALADPAVERVALAIDSPGGTIAGVQELADQIYEARGGAKPITAHISDTAASAAYWLASQASTIEANRSAVVGSIGVYRVLVDSSQAYADQGVKVHLIKSGEHKGTGTPGAPISAENIEAEQEIIDNAAGMFLASVARGRSMPPARVAQLATGRSWFADEAADLGLIDQVSGVAQTQDAQPLGGAEEGSVMGEPSEGQQAAERVKLLTAENKEQNDALETVRHEVEQLRIEVAARDVELAALRAGQRREIIDAGIQAGKITPAMREHVEKFADACGDDLAELTAFVGSLEARTRPDPVSQTPANQPAPSVSNQDAFIARLLGIRDAATLSRAGEWQSIRADGRVYDAAGNEIKNLEGLN